MEGVAMTPPPSARDRNNEAMTPVKDKAGEAGKRMSEPALFAMPEPTVDNKFHNGNGDDGKHYWLTPPELYAALDAEFGFTRDVCPYPFLPDQFDGLRD